MDHQLQAEQKLLLAAECCLLAEMELLVALVAQVVGVVEQFEEVSVISAALVVIAPADLAALCSEMQADSLPCRHFHHLEHLEHAVSEIS